MKKKGNGFFNFHKRFMFAVVLLLGLTGCEKSLLRETAQKLIKNDMESVISNRFQSIREKLAHEADSLKSLSDALKSSMPTEQRLKADSIELFVNGPLAYLQVLEGELIEISGGLSADGTLKLPRNHKDPTNFLVGKKGEKNGKAYELAYRLNKSVALLNSMNKEFKFDKLAKHGWEIEMFKDEPKHKKRDFVQLNFEGSPLVACLAIFSRLAKELRQMEYDALKLLVTHKGLQHENS